MTTIRKKPRRRKSDLTLIKRRNNSAQTSIHPWNQDPNAEGRVLSGVIHDAKLFGLARASLTTDHFYYPDNRELFAAMEESNTTNPKGLEKIYPGAEEHCGRLIAKVSERAFRANIEKLKILYSIRHPNVVPIHKDGLPLIENSTELVANGKPCPPELVGGMLHKGSKMILGGPSKAFKSWVLLALAISVALGLRFWGLKTTQGSVLYINLEIQAAFFSKRVAEICRAKGVDPPEFLDIWNLRGHAASAHELLPTIIERVKSGRYALIIIDPFYKIMGGADENSAGSVAVLLNELEKLAVQTGAAVVFGAHFAKGNASGKEAIDRVSGSGSFARDPDSIVMMTRHKEEDSFTIDTILRNFPPMDPFVVRREHPLMVRDDELNPTDLKRPKGGLTKRTVDEILEVLPAEGATAGDWQVVVEAETGIGYRRFFELKKEAEEQGLLVRNTRNAKIILRA